MFVVTRFRALEEDSESFRVRLLAIADALRQCPGVVDVETGRNLDDTSVWVLVSRWEGVGSYRRALSSYDVKVALAAIQARALEEPSAYEPATGELNRNLPR